MLEFDKGLYKVWFKLQESSQLELDRILDELFSLYVDGCLENNDKDWDYWLDKYLLSLADDDGNITDTKGKLFDTSFVNTDDYRKENRYWYLKSNLLTEYTKKRNSMLLNYTFDKYATGAESTRYPIADSKLETFVILNCFWKFYIYIPLKADNADEKEEELLADLTNFCGNLSTPYTTEEIVNFALSPFFRSMLKYKKVYHYGNLGDINDVDEPEEDDEESVESSEVKHNEYN
jgi:hypothetical protein